MQQTPFNIIHSHIQYSRAWTFYRAQSRLPFLTPEITYIYELNPGLPGESHKSIT